MFKQFGFEIYNVMPLRKAFLLSTDKGDKILKKINYTLEEFNFVVSILEYIKKNFNRVVNFVKTADGKNYCIENGEMYCVMDMIEGKECEFANPVDVSIAALGLGELHKASEGYRTKLANQNYCGALIENIKRKKDEILFFNKISNLYEVKTEFDDIFIQNVEYYVKRIDETIEVLKKSQYYKLCSEEDKIVICHHDLAHHNIIINDGKAYFIDFDYAVIDLKVHDICNLIIKAVKNFDYSLNNAIIVLDNYCKVNTLNKNELEVLYGLLSVPEDFYNISKDYYTRRKEWTKEVFIRKFNEKVSQEKSRIDFLNEFKREILDKF